jgi:hypothetical protein
MSLVNTYLGTIQKPQGVEHASNTVSYSNTTILRIALVACLVLAPPLPMAAIAVLYTVTSMPKRIGIDIFTTTLSLCLDFLTRARVVALFAATADKYTLLSLRAREELR